MNLKFALATARDVHKNGPAEDQLILAALRNLGAEARLIIWDETDPTDSVSNLNGETVVIRTTWDYQGQYLKFIRWLEAIPKAGINLVNPLAHLLGTIDKRYLVDLYERGFAVPETMLCPPSRETLRGALGNPAFAQAVIKPVVGAGAFGLKRIAAANPETWQDLDTLAPHILQRFLPEVESEGELSFVFFGGTYSHAVRKRARPGDIRVQVDWGGTVEVIAPSSAQVVQAAHFLNALPSIPAYARVDVVEVAGRLMLMELEVIEPELFCLYVPGAAERFAAVLVDDTYLACDS